LGGMSTEQPAVCSVFGTNACQWIVISILIKRAQRAMAG
jgi:hypothetical protein